MCSHVCLDVQEDGDRWS